MDWRVIAASVRGTSHEKTGQECQDAYCWRVLKSGAVVAAVADGAGSASFGRQGAEVAARAAVEALEETCSQRLPATSDHWWGVLCDSVGAARTGVEREAASLGAPLRELATTLILIVAAPDQVVAAQIGDGAAVVHDRHGHVLALTRPPDDEFINQTTFLTADDPVESCQMNMWQGEPAHIAALTDGLQMLALRMPDGAPHAPFFRPLFQFVAGTPDAADGSCKLDAFLRSPRITDRTDDDLTLLLAGLVP